MSRIVCAGFIWTLLASVAISPAWANGWNGTSCYYPTYPIAPPQYCYQAPIIPCPAPLIPVPVVQKGLAQPTPAPPSQTKEPPVGVKKPPQVTESKSFSIGDGKGVAELLDANGKEMCRVGFWNVSGKDVTLTVNGKSYSLPRNRNVTLPVSRAFTWQVSGQAAQSDRVGADQLTHEIVIR